MTDTQRQKFLSLASQMSPENLSCDGEASTVYMRRTMTRIRKEWKALEKQVGRKVTEAEIWAWEMASM